MSRDGWYKTLRFLSTICGFGILYASIKFSAQFFGIKNESMVWLGVLIGVTVTIIEFTWRKEGMKGNWTMDMIGALSYTYGIVTNALGILMAWGINATLGLENLFADPVSLVMAFFTGLILEVTAEPLISWGITGDAMTDLFGGAMEMINEPSGNKKFQNFNTQKPQQQSQQPKQQPQEFRPQSKPMTRPASSGKDNPTKPRGDMMGKTPDFSRMGAAMGQQTKKNGNGGGNYASLEAEETDW